MKNSTITYSLFAIAVAILAVFAFGVIQPAIANVQNEIDQRNEQIAELQRQIAEFQKQIELNQGKASTLSGEIAGLNARIGKIQAEINSLSLSIEDTDTKILTTEEQIFEAQLAIETHKAALAANLQEMYEINQKSLALVLLENDQLSDFFTTLNDVTTTQQTLQSSIEAIGNAKIDLENRESDLRDQRGELESLLAIQASQKGTLDSAKYTKNKILQETRGEEQRYQDLVKKNERDINAIRAQITFLLESGLTVEDVIAQAQLAALRLGVRPAYLVAAMEVETNLGRNQGTGNWRDDMYQCRLDLAAANPSRATYFTNAANKQRDAFFRITAKLGLNPDEVKVSAAPNYGCGGAMGFAQFMPATWEGYEERITALTGHNPPSPWNAEDAFTAAGLYLVNGGAAEKTREAEIRASKAYISGSPTCSSSICNYYANLIQNKADILEANWGE